MRREQHPENATDYEGEIKAAPTRASMWLVQLTNFVGEHDALSALRTEDATFSMACSPAPTPIVRRRSLLSLVGIARDQRRRFTTEVLCASPDAMALAILLATDAAAALTGSDARCA